MNSISYVKCYRNGNVVRTELCMTLWEADMVAKELRETGWYDEVKIIRGDDDAELV